MSDIVLEAVQLSVDAHGAVGSYDRTTLSHHLQTALCSVHFALPQLPRGL